MNWKLMLCALAASLLSGAVYAQMGGDDGGDETDVSEEVQFYMDIYDADEDGKISRAEVKKAAEENAEDDSEIKKLEAYGDALVEFLAADDNGDDTVTKDELTKYFKLIYAGKKPKLTAKDWKTIESVYLDPDLALVLKEHDKDGDKQFNKDEAKAIKIEGEAFTTIDADKDGKLSADELKAAYKQMMSGTYEIEAGEAAVDPEEKPEVPPEIMKKAKAAFGEWDTDGDGFATKAEVKALGKGEETANWWGRYIGFLAMDTDDDLKVSFDEFLAAGLAGRAGKKGKLYPADKKEACKEVWAELDGDSDGKVTEAEWKKMFPNSDEYAGADTDKNGDLSQDEFWTLLKPNLEGSFEFMEKDKPSKSDSGNGGTEEKPADDQGSNDGDTDAWALYKKKGRSWTYKIDAPGMVMYSKTEVLEVAEDHAKIRSSTLDKDGNAFMGMKPIESEVKFTKSDGGADVEAPEMRKVEKTIKVEAGEFECVGYAAGDAEPEVWVSKKYTGLIVKSKNLELHEFKDE